MLNFSYKNFLLKFTQSLMEYCGTSYFKLVMDGEHDSGNPKEVIEI